MVGADACCLKVLLVAGHELDVVPAQHRARLADGRSRTDVQKPVTQRVRGAHDRYDRAMPPEFHVSPRVDDERLSDLHRRAFGSDSGASMPWSARLRRHSILWVTAEDDSGLVGFVNVVGDGGVHAFLLDTVVSPDRQGEGIGKRLVEIAAAEARALGCEWLHVDFEDRMAGFYLEGCGFRRTAAGLLRLR